MWREITKSLDGLQRRSTNGNLIPPLSSAFLVRAITWVTLKCSILGCLSRLHMLRELEESVRTAFSTSANEDEGPGDTGLLGDWDSRLQITEVRWRRCCCVAGCLIDSENSIFTSRFFRIQALLLVGRWMEETAHYEPNPVIQQLRVSELKFGFRRSCKVELNELLLREVMRRVATMSAVIRTPHIPELACEQCIFVRQVAKHVASKYRDCLRWPFVNELTWFTLT